RGATKPAVPGLTAEPAYVATVVGACDVESSPQGLMGRSSEMREQSDKNDDWNGHTNYPKKHGTHDRLCRRWLSWVYVRVSARQLFVQQLDAVALPATDG